MICPRCEIWGLHTYERGKKENKKWRSKMKHRPLRGGGSTSRPCMAVIVPGMTIDPRAAWLGGGVTKADARTAIPCNRNGYDTSTGRAWYPSFCWELRSSYYSQAVDNENAKLFGLSFFFFFFCHCFGVPKRIIVYMYASIIPGMRVRLPWGWPGICCRPDGVFACMPLAVYSRLTLVSTAMIPSMLLLLLLL